MLKKAIFLSIFAFAFVASASAAINPVTPSKDDGCYAIGTKEELYGFAALLNGTDVSEDVLTSCAKLTQNITINTNVLDANNNLTRDTSEYELWTPIKMFKGVFDGQNKTISGLFIKPDGYGYVGMFAEVAGATIKNVGIMDSYVHSTYNVAGIFVGSISYQIKATSTIENSFVKNSMVVSSNYAVGGFVGLTFFTFKMKNCYNENTSVIQRTYGGAGGLVGVGDITGLFSIENSYVTGNVYGYHAGGIVGIFQGDSIYVVNNYFSGSVTGNEKGNEHVASVIGWLSSSNPVKIIEHNYSLVGSVSSIGKLYDEPRMINGISVAEYDVKWGALAVLLNGYNANGVNGSVWGQNVAGGEDHPTFYGTLATVPVSAKLSLVTYDGDTLVYPTIYIPGQENNDLPVITRGGYRFKGWYTNESFTSEPVKSIPITATGNLTYYAKFESMKNVDGCYEIYDADELYSFAGNVNDHIGENSYTGPVCAKLMADIVLNKNVLNKDGSLSSDSSRFKKWTPIGQDLNEYFYGLQVAFDGQGHSISGLYVNEPNNVYAGFFSYLTTRGSNYNYTSTIKNLNFKDSYVRGNTTSSFVGGLVGFSNTNLNVENVSFDGKVVGYNVGGLIGYFYSSALDLKGCGFSGSVNTTYGYTGGLVAQISGASNVSIANSFNHGTMNGYAEAGGLLGNVSIGYLSIVNSYNAGSVSGNNYVGGFVGYMSGSNVLIANSFVTGSLNTSSSYYAANAFWGYCGVYKEKRQVYNSYYSDNLFDSLSVKTSETAIANGAIAMALHNYEKDVLWYFYPYGNTSSMNINGSVWGQDVSKETHPTLSGVVKNAQVVANKITLVLSDGSIYEDSYTEGLEKILPSLVDEKMISAWYVSKDYTGKTESRIPYNAKGEKIFYGKVSTLKLVDGCYSIDSVDDLFDFAKLVNGGESSVCGDLTSDIVVNSNVLSGDKSGLREWIPIGETATTPFNGVFDGNGHVISGLYAQDASVAGLFGYVTTNSNAVVIKNVGVVDSYLQAQYAAGIAYYVNITNTGTVSLENTFFAGLTDSYDGAGLIGSATIENTLSVINSYSVDVPLSGSWQYPMIYGVSFSSSENLNLSKAFYYSEGYGNTYGTVIGQNALARGTLAEILHQGTDDVDGSIWGQNVTDGEFYPVFGGKLVGTETVVSKVTYHLDDGSIVEDTYTEGIRKSLPNKLNGREIYEWHSASEFSEENYVAYFSTSATGDIDLYERIKPLEYVDGCYVINDAEGLSQFATNVSNYGESTACGKLGRDIVFNKDVLDENGQLKTEKKFKYWFPIGNYSGDGYTYKFKGSFDGQGHVIYGLVTSEYVTNTGLVGYAENATIKNVGIEDSYFLGKESGASIVGKFDGELTLENVYAVCTVALTSGSSGGIRPLGRLIGDNNYATSNISNSYHVGRTIGYGSYYQHGLVGFSWTDNIKNSFFLDEGRDGSSSAEEFADGTIAEQLHNGDNGSIWGQNVKNGDKYPNFSGVVIVGSSEKGVIVYHLPSGDTAMDSYTVGMSKILPKEIKGEKIIAWYDNSEMEGSPVTSISELTAGDVEFYGKGPAIVLVNGCYEIKNADALYEFADIVNGGEISACGKLTANIVVNEDVLDAEGNLKNDLSTYRLWKPIGFVDVESGTFNFFTGVFDGQGHTISGLVTDGSNIYEGLFGAVSSMEETTIIRNVGVVDSYIQGALVGSIAGVISGYSIVVENVYAETSVNGVGNGSSAGGIVAIFEGRETARLSNSYFAGSISGLNKKAIAYNCDVRAENNFFIGETDDDYGTAKSAEEFANGTVAELLHARNSIWGQNVAKGDKYPNFSGKVVKTEIALDWDNASETVTIDASKVDEFTEVIVEPGKEFYYNGAIYKDTLNLAQIEEIDGKELKPISGVSLEKGEDNNLVASLSTGAVTDKVIIPEDIEVSDVDIGIDFVPGKTMTLMLPFDYDVPEGLGTISEFTRVEKIDGVWTATGTRVSNNHIKAHTPYLIHVAEESDGKLASGSVTIKANINVDSDAGEGSWTFKGTYEGKTWGAGDPELGHAYGFAGQQKDNASPGDFVRVGAGAAIPPMRAYLVHASAAVQPEPAGMPAARYAPEEPLPKRIVVRIIDGESGDVLEEGEMDGSGEIQSLMPVKSNFEAKENRWHDIKGRHLNHKPNAKGAYLKNGKPVLVK
ncbi:MAG: InlB B-repeat-containing protein [Fibrobacter sp.]|nr:InlB B-repeat-containing protein [Fibrobacter sp.]